MNVAVASAPHSLPRVPSPERPTRVANPPLNGAPPRPPISRLYRNELPRSNVGTPWRPRNGDSRASHAGSSSVAPPQPPLWQGAWVGWLTCQAVLLVLVEGTELAADPRLALVTRVLLVTGFVAAFRRPCFATRLERNLFTCAVLVAEVTIAGCCDRLADTTGWTLWAAIGAGLLLASTALTPSRDQQSTAAQ